MDELFNGLSCRLRVPGLVADSIMMGIVNSAMEEAYEKVCSKKGDIERLNEKSRFCELAVMQLEWCLKFIQEKVDIYVVESNREREKLVSELTNTRDRIQKRLQETELAIAKKDKEMRERVKNELRLSQALKAKGEELSSLHVTLELKRTKSDRVQEFVHSNQMGGVDDGDDEFCELKNSLDQQFWNIKRKLEDGRVHSTDEISKLNGCCYNELKSDAVVLEPKFELVEELIYNVDGMTFSLDSEDKQANDCKQSEFYENDRGSHFDMLSSCVQTEVMERNFEFELMGTDIDVLKEMMEVGFEMMSNTISLSKLGLLEQQWEWNVEKEMVALVLRGFLRDVEENFKTKYFHGQKDMTPNLTEKNWSSLMGDIKSLRCELKQLLVIQTDFPCMPLVNHELGMHSSSSSQMDFGNKGILQKLPFLKKKTVDTNFCGDAPRKCPTNSPRRRGKSDTFLKSQEFCSLEDVSSESAAGHSQESCFLEDHPQENAAGHSHHLVAEMIKNHESIIKKKTEEISSQKVEIIEEWPCGHRKDKGFDRAKKLIPEIIFRLDTIIQEYAHCHVNLDGYERGNCSLLRILSKQILAEDEKVAVRTLTENSEKLGNAKLSCLDDVDSREQIKELKQEREDFYIQALMAEDMHMIVFKEFVKQMSLEVENNEMESLIKEDLSTISFKEMVKEWNSDRESCNIESLIREEIYQIVISEFIKHSKSSISLLLANCQEDGNQDPLVEDLPLANFLQSLEIRKGSCLMREPDSMQNTFESMEDFILSSTELMEIDSHFYCGDWKHEELDEDSIYKDDAFNSVKSKLEKALQHIKMSKAQLKELGCSLGIAVGDGKEANHQVALFEGIAQDMPNGERQWNALEFVVLPLEYFSKAINDFEHIIQEKQGVHIMRLEKAKRQLEQLIQRVPPIKAKELLYRNAFLRRCYNLQIAEAEVDLLGDKVDALLCLLEKIYMTLNHYLPVLQHYSGIMDILKLIRKELNGEADLTNIQ